MRNLRHIATAPWLWFGLVMTVFAYLTPYAFDSDAFEAEFLAKTAGGNFLSGYTDYINTVRLNDNWRLAQILSPLLTLYLPKWLTALITGVSTAYTLYILVRLMLPQSVSRRQAHCVQAIIMWAIILLLPWRNNMLVFIVTMNYIPVAAAALMALSIALNKSRSTPCTVVCILAAIAAATGHEQIAISCGAAMICAAIVPIIKHKIPASSTCISTAVPYNTATTRHFLLFLGCLTAALGTVWVMTSHIVMRAVAESSAPAWQTAPAKILLFNIPVILLWLGLILSAATARSRAYIVSLISDNIAFTFFAVAAGAGTIISLFVSYAPRSAYWPQLCAIGAWGIVFYPLLLKFSARTQSIVTAASMLLFGIVSIHAGIWIHRVGKAYSDARAAIAISSSGTVYCHPVYAYDIPRTALGMASNVIFMEPIVYHCLTERFGRPVAFVPAGLEHVSIPATPDSIYRTSDGTLYMRPSSPVREPIISTLGADNSTTTVTLLAFTHPSGITLYLIIPHYQIPSSTVLTLSE